jgi:hypothetical protein
MKRAFGYIIFCCAVATLLPSCTDDDESVSARQPFPDSLQGIWVRVYPDAGGADTLVLDPEGIASGPVTAVAGRPMAGISRWQIGSPVGITNDLCVGDAVVFSCSGYQVRGDTLALANGQQTVLVRAGSVDVEEAGSDFVDKDDRARFGDMPPTSTLRRNIPR